MEENSRKSQVPTSIQVPEAEHWCVPNGRYPPRSGSGAGSAMETNRRGFYRSRRSTFAAAHRRGSATSSPGTREPTKVAGFARRSTCFFSFNWGRRIYHRIRLAVADDLKVWVEQGEKGLYVSKENGGGNEIFCDNETARLRAVGYWRTRVN